MEAQHLSGEGFEDISFQLHKGEVLAITGLQGSGRDELADALFGDTRQGAGLASAARRWKTPEILNFT